MEITIIVLCWIIVVLFLLAAGFLVISNIVYFIEVAVIERKESSNFKENEYVDKKSR